jgi:2,3-bisphosphoglycerate-independent phosphoglycerate mutase
MIVPDPGPPRARREPGARRPTRALVVFLDGVGIGPSDEDLNPFTRARLPVLRRLLDGHVPTLENPVPDGTPARVLSMDACLGVDGLPQSGTGQISLLTGRNASRLFGRHFGPWPPVRLRPLLERENLLVRARAAGLEAVFANAYPAGYPEGRDPRLVAALPLAARAAGALWRDHRALARGEAVASEILNQGWREHLGFHDLPPVTEVEAGHNLAGIASGADLTLYAHYQTDTAGHRGGMKGAVAALERVDRFLGGVLESLSGESLLLVVSDHGNVEDVRGGHTRNPALGLALGPGAGAFPARPTVAEITPTLLQLLTEHAG